MAAINLLPGVSFRSLDEEHDDPLPAGGSLLLATDHIDAPADFLLIRAATVVLKSSKAPNGTGIKRCIFMTFAREPSHWRAILGKSVSRKEKCSYYKYVLTTGVERYWRTRWE